MIFQIDDKNIIRHYLARLEQAIEETKQKYGKVIYRLAFNILYNYEDAEECEEDTYLKLWNSIPPKQPDNFKAYCMRIARNTALTRFQYNHADKRDVNLQLSLDGLIEEYGDFMFSQSVDAKDSERLSQCFNRFLESLSAKKRKVFLLRYWYFMPVKDIMTECNLSQSQVESILFRIRKKLKEELCKEGYLNE